MTSDTSSTEAVRTAGNTAARKTTWRPPTFPNFGVGPKIYSVVGLCLVLLLVVGATGIWQMWKIGVELVSIAERDIPLTNGLTKVTNHQIEQAVQFERALRTGAETATNPEARRDFDRSVQRFKSLPGA